MKIFKPALLLSVSARLPGFHLLKSRFLCDDVLPLQKIHWQTMTDDTEDVDVDVDVDKDGAESSESSSSEDEA